MAGCTALGLWADGTSCKLCHSSCATCSGPGVQECLSCAADGRTPFLHGTECVERCPEEGTYAEASSRQFLASSDRSDPGLACHACDESCGQCSGPSSSQCTACGEAFPYADAVPFESGACLAGCPAGKFALLGPSDEGVPRANATCLRCDATCEACDGGGPTGCTACRAGTVLYEGEGRLHGSCVDDCGFGFFNKAEAVAGEEGSGEGGSGEGGGSECEACDAACASCDGAGPDSCTSCSGAVLFEGKCASSCPVGTFQTSLDVCEGCRAECATCGGPGAADCLSCPATGTPFWHDGRCL